MTLRLPACLPLLLAMLAGTTPAQTLETAEGPVSVRVQTTQTLHTISPRLFGTNLQWEHGGDGILQNGDPRRIDPAVLNAIKEAGISVIRFPGGDLSNTYLWRHGAGRHEQRPKGKSYGGSEVASLFGSDELLRLTEKTGQEALITVNTNAGEAEAADWVDYLNGDSRSAGGRQRIANGFSSPLRVRYWEIGNELYSPHQPGHQSAAAYAATVRRFAATMKARDPSIRIGANLEASFMQAPWMPKVLPHLVNWNETVFREAGRELDFVILHFYAPHETLWNDSELRGLVLAGPEVFRRTLQQILTLIREHGRPDTEVVVSEFGTAFGEKLVLSRRIASTEGALFSASLLFAMMREPRITVANNWSLLNNSQFGMLEHDGPLLRPRPIYDVYKLLKPWHGGHSLTITLTGPTYAVTGHGSVPTMPKVALVDAQAVREADGSLSVALLNRSDRKTLPAQLVFENLPAGAWQATRTVLSAKPAAEQWRHDTHPAKVLAGNALTLELPPHSLTLVRLHATGKARP